VDPDFIDVPAIGHDAICYRFFDATPQAEFTCRALCRTVEEDLQKRSRIPAGF